MTPQEFIDKFGIHYGKDELMDTDDCVVEINDGELKDIACPDCGYRNRFIVRIKAEGTAFLNNYGIDCCDFDDDSGTRTDRRLECYNCNYEGEHDFHIPGLDAALEALLENGRAEAEDNEESEPEPSMPEQPEQIPPPPTMKWGGIDQ